MITAPASRDPVAILVGFGRVLRSVGVPATPDRVQSMALAVDELGGVGRSEVYWAGRVTTCASPQDVARYDAAFAAYFSDRRDVLTRSRRSTPTARMVAQPVPDNDAADLAEIRPDQDSVAATASELEILRHADLARLGDADRLRARRLVAALRVAGPTRLTRRRGPARSGHVDGARTLRAMVRQGGEPALLLHHAPTRRPRRVVFLLDVSGSMTPYAEWTLLFAHAMARARRGTEVFTIGTRLTRVSRELRQGDPDQAVRDATALIPDWSGGTRLGEELATFVREHGQRGMARGAVVVIASDGWERGSPALLGEQMAWLSRLGHRVVWVNPHTARLGFAPSTAGMTAALPYIDDLVAGHSVAAFESLARFLGGEVASRA